VFDKRLASIEQYPGTTGLAIGLSQHADEDRSERPALNRSVHGAAPFWSTWSP
jgi:hypothetical protein